MKPGPERAFDLLAAASVLAWGVAGLVKDGPTAVRLAIASLDVAVGLLFLRRRPLLRAAEPGDLLLALPSLVVAGLAFRGAPPTPEWPGSAACVFGVGTVWTLWALGTLGGNFAVLPAFRGVTVTGPYALVRHPAYAGELTLVAACWLAGAPWWSPPAAAALVALRILGEERTLARSDAWRAYARRVPWRLVPRIW